MADNRVRENQDIANGVMANQRTAQKILEDVDARRFWTCVTQFNFRTTR